MNLSFQSIVKRFDAVTAVDGVSLEIRDGECFFLLGPSGGNRQYKGWANHWYLFNFM